MDLPSSGEYLILFDQFAAGAALPTTIMNYTACRNSFGTAFIAGYYTGIFYYEIENGLIDASSYGPMFYVKNISNAASIASAYAQKCLISMQYTQISLGSYFDLFPNFTSYLIAFLMNFTGNILSIY